MVNFPLGTQLLGIVRGLKWMINACILSRNCLADTCLEPLVFTLSERSTGLKQSVDSEASFPGFRFSSISVVTLGNFLISLCLSFLIWKVGLLLALPQEEMVERS